MNRLFASLNAAGKAFANAWRNHGTQTDSDPIVTVRKPYQTQTVRMRLSKARELGLHD